MNDLSQKNIHIKPPPRGEGGESVVLTDSGKRFNRDWIFRHLTYTFTPGKAYAITGPNGSGKSTLLQAIAGSMHLSEGAVEYRIGNMEQGTEEQGTGKQGTRNRKHQTPNTKLQTPNPKLQTPNPKPQTPNT